MNWYLKRHFCRAAAALVVFGIVFLSVYHPVRQTPAQIIPAVSFSAPESTTAEINSTHDYNGKTLAQLYAENADTIGWLSMPNTKTDNVVVLGEDAIHGQNYYLDHDFNGNVSSYGSLYIDYRCIITASQMSQNLTVYGHHMKDGTMLANLDKYKSRSFFEQNPVIHFNTLWAEYDWEVFAVFSVNLKVASDAAFDYRQPDFTTQSDFLALCNEAKSRSYYDTGVTLHENDHIISLSTCTYPTGNPTDDNARLVLMARRIDSSAVSE